MDKPTSQETVSSAQAVMLGALASGVNASLLFHFRPDSMFEFEGPTNIVHGQIVNQAGFSGFNVVCDKGHVLHSCSVSLRNVVSSDFTMILHVVILVSISGVLFFLLNRFLSETGLVSIEQQIQEMMGLAPKDHAEPSKTE